MSRRILMLAAPFLLLATTAMAQPWRIPPEKMHRGVDPVAKVELARPHDPTFVSVASYYPALKSPREALGVLQSAREFIVTRYGEIELNNHQMDKPNQPEAYPDRSPENLVTLYFRFGSKIPYVRYGQGNAPDSKSLVDGYLPIVVVPFAHQGVEYRQTLFAWSQGMDPDARLWAYVGLEMKNPTRTPVRVELSQQALCGKLQRRST